MAPRTHIHVDEVVSWDPCKGFRGKERLSAIFGGEYVPIENMIFPPHPERWPDTLPAKPDESFWGLSHLFTRDQCYDWLIITVAKVRDEHLSEKEKRFIAGFVKMLEGIKGHSEDPDHLQQVHDKMQYLEHRRKQRVTEADRRLLLILDIMWNVLNIDSIWKSTRVCARLMNELGLSYDETIDLGIRIVKEQV